MSVRVSGAAGDYYSIGDISPFNPSGSFTLWVEHFLVSSTGTLFSKWQGSADRSFLLDFASGTYNFNILGTDNNGYGANTTGYARMGQWVGVGSMYDGTGISVYSNGSIGARTNSVAIKNSTIGVILAGRTDSSNPMSGRVRRVATWDAALTLAEFRALERGVPPLRIRRGSLSGYWPLAMNTDDVLGTGSWTRNGNATLDVETPSSNRFSIGFTASIPAEQALPVPFAEFGTEMFVPTLTEVAQILDVPFFPTSFAMNSVTLVEGDLPPFVPPSLPPTIPSGTPVGPGVPLPPLSSGGLAGIRFYQGPPWRWLVTDLETNTITFLDRLAAEAVVTYGLDKGSTAKLSVPSDNPEVNILHTDGDPFVSEGNRLLYGFRREGDGPLWQCRFGGKILLVEDTGLTEDARTVITAFDPWHLLYQRPMVNIDDEFADRAGFFSFDDTQVGVIALTFLRNTIINQGEVGIDVGDNDFATVDDMPGTQYWGHPYKAVWSGRTKSVYETTTQVDTDCQQGLMVGEVWDQQVQTGALDLLLTPIYDPVNRPGYLAELSIYERAGRVADDAVFAWDKPSRNITRINRVIDGTKRANTIRYSWGEGGPPVSGGIPISDGASITKYGETWHMQYWPGRIEAAALALEQLQLELMKDGITTVEVQPTSERMPFLFTEWWLGDTVPEFASSKLRAPLAGFQRIYGIVINIDVNGFEQVPQLLVSPDDA